MTSNTGEGDSKSTDNEAWLKKRGQEKFRLNKLASKEKRIGSLEGRRRTSRSRKGEEELHERQLLSGNGDRNVDDRNEDSGSDARPLSENEEKELAGLMKAGLAFEEQYSVVDFTEEHIAFKATHNQLFASLIQYVQNTRLSQNQPGAQTESRAEYIDDAINIFYLDGPDAGTSLALLQDIDDERTRIRPEQCYIANRHGSTCETLSNLFPGMHVAHASAADALSSISVCADTNAIDDEEERESDDMVFGHIPFSALYLDGCGGHIPLIVEMMDAAFDHYTNPNSVGSSLDQIVTEERQISPPYPIAIGFSILGGNKDVVDKEQDVIRALVSMVKRRQLGLRVDHVLDDPERYGISAGRDVRKVDGGTMTTWVMLERDDR